MEKSTMDPKRNIVSLRVSKEDREYLDRLCSATNRSVSDLMREALHKLPVPEIPAYPAVSRMQSARRRAHRHAKVGR